MAGFNINDFRSNISSLGILKSSGVLIRIYPTNAFGLNQFGSVFNPVYNAIEFSGEATKIPGVSLATTEIRRHGYGVIEKKPYVPIFTDIDVAFRSDRDGNIYKFFQTWMKMIINFDGRASINSVTGIMPQQGLYEISYKDNYMSTIVLHIKESRGGEPLTVVLTEAYPIFLGEIPFAWASVNDYVKIPVRFTFKDWYLQNLEITNQNNLIEPLRNPQPWGPALTP